MWRTVEFVGLEDVFAAENEKRYRKLQTTHLEASESDIVYGVEKKPVGKGRNLGYIM